jgi:hypothetical protein
VSAIASEYRQMVAQCEQLASQADAEQYIPLLLLDLTASHDVDLFHVNPEIALA